MASTMLPLETLAHIFEYLDDFDDLKSVTLVCKHWLKATQVAKILKNYKLTFSSVTVDSHTEPSTLFASSDRVFSNICFDNAKFSYVDPVFWVNWMEFITEITFNYKFRSPELPGNFVELLVYTPQLKTLNVICSLRLFNRYFLELNPEDRELVIGNIRNVQELRIHFSEECFLLYFEFGSWIDEMTNLKTIEIDVNSRKRVIPDQAYDEMLTFIEKFQTKVKGFHLFDYFRPLRKDVAERLFNLKDMKLKAFDVSINPRTSTQFVDFVCTQSDLEYLRVDGSFRMKRTLRHLPKLKQLALLDGPAMDVLTAFRNLKKLESLWITGLEYYYELMADKNKNYKYPKLKEFYMIDAAVDFTPCFAERLSKSFMNLQLLNLDGLIIDESCYPHLYQLKKLRVLKMSRTQITDRDFVGVPSSQKRRKAENGQSIPVNESTVSISSLTELEVLHIDFCRELTGHSYHTMQLKKLKHLSAQGARLDACDCDALAENSPDIESLNLSNCHLLFQYEIEAIIGCFKKLKTLELESCANIDMDCITHIMESETLQTLNLSKTNIDVSKIAEEMFSRMKTLRKIISENRRFYRCSYE